MIEIEKIYIGKSQSCKTLYAVHIKNVESTFTDVKLSAIIKGI